jgi:hypothetical protein
MKSAATAPDLLRSCSVQGERFSISFIYKSKEQILLIIYIIGSDTEETTHEPLRSVNSDSVLGTPPLVFDENQNEDYENQADEIINEIWRMFNNKNSWSYESKSRDGLDTVVSKSFPKWGKVFRLTVRK